jgi:hypothetical protein
MLGIDRRRAAAALLALAAVLHADGAQAQRRDDGVEERRIGIGYVANIPNMFLGGSVTVTPLVAGFGLYADVKFDVESPADDEDEFIDSLTARDVDENLNDQVFGQDGSWTSVNVALVRAISPELAVYAGGGVGWRKEYVQYFDPDQELGVAGLYWVEDTEISGTYLNAMGGVMLRLTSAVTAQFGAESSPPGFTVGLSLTLPR